MRCWAVTVSEDQFAEERLYAHESLTVPADPVRAGANGAGALPRTGDLAALVVAGPPRLFGLGVVRDDASAGGGVVVRYTHRLFDGPVRVADIVGDAAGPGLSRLDPDRYASLARRAAGGAAGRSEWFVTVALPIEAESPAEAVREFWTHIAKLGPRELPAYVWPRGDELAMQAFVLGEEANLDPEED